MKRTKKVIVANPKGGPGKTTISLGLTFGLARLGHKVAIYDTDGQGNFLDALALGLKDEKNVRLYEAGDTDSDVVIFDSPPRADERPMLQAFDESDLVPFPLRDAPGDLLAAARSIPPLVARDPRKRIFIVHSQLRTNRVLSENFEVNVRDIGIQLPILKTAVHQYECYENLIREGWGALTDAGRLELQILSNEVMALLREKTASRS